MTPLEFVYCNSHGELKNYSITRWAESGHYIKGIDALTARFLTFRKDRVHRYLNGCSAQLARPFSAPPPRIHRTAPVDGRPQILFTGFAVAERADMELKADAAGLRVVKTVTQGLVFLCGGPRAGPMKLEKARDQHVYIVNAREFQALIETGELPDHAVDDLAD